MPNILVRNATIVDGTGHEGFWDSVHVVWGQDKGGHSIADNITVKETARRPTGIEKVFIIRLRMYAFSYSTFQIKIEGAL